MPFAPTFVAGFGNFDFVCPPCLVCTSNAWIMLELNLPTIVIVRRRDVVSPRLLRSVLDISMGSKSERIVQWSMYTSCIVLFRSLNV